MNIDTEINGVTTAPGSFPDDDKLYVRYRAHLENRDKFAGVLGLSIGLKRGFSVQGEWNGSPNGNRFQLAGTYRF